MPIALNCIIREDALPVLKRLRGQHLTYIDAHRDEILFGGPARAPEEMMIVLRTDDADAARAFINSEPYTASGQVFAELKLRSWSQIIPEVKAGALAQAIAEEHSKKEAR